MISNFKKILEPIIAIIAYPFLSWNPSILTWLSLVAAILFFVGVLSHVYWLSIVSILGFLFDVLDGHVARAQKKVTAYGGFLDSTLDRASDFFFITSFGFARIVSWEIVVFVLTTSFLISYMRSRGDLAFGLGHAPAEGLIQRPERILLLLLAFFVYLLLPTAELFHLPPVNLIFLLILLLNCITLIQRFLFFAKVKK